MEVVVGRVGRPQGVRGEVTVEVRTDEPEVRFAPGARLLTRRQDDPSAPGEPPEVRVARTRWQSGRMMLALEGVADRDAAEALRGLLLAVEVDPDARPDDPEEFYDHQLVGLAVRTADGTAVGEVAEVLHLPSQDVLSVRRPDGRDVLVPFVAAIVTDVDVRGGALTVDPPAGLLDDSEAEVARDPGEAGG